MATFYSLTNEDFEMKPINDRWSRAISWMVILALGGTVGMADGQVSGQTGETELIVLPQEVELDRRTASQRVLVHDLLTNGEVGNQWSISDVRWKTSNSNVARIEEGERRRLPFQPPHPECLALEQRREGGARARYGRRGR